MFLGTISHVGGCDHPLFFFLSSHDSWDSAHISYAGNYQHSISGQSPLARLIFFFYRFNKGYRSHIRHQIHFTAEGYGQSPE